ncbi:MAG: IS1634 family transposase [Acidimicrobiaceae bacterium]|nr:IS1634 family transposase [Acidimicrobiaceae bacterium]
MLGAMPIVNHFIARLELDDALDAALPHDDARVRLAPSRVLGVLVRHLVVEHRPLYEIAEWTSRFSPELLGLHESGLVALNDDRVGRTLARLFDADQASLLTSVVAMVRTFEIDCTQLHNDSTSITVTGSHYGGASRRGEKPVAEVTFGHGKDHRPDLRQLVWLLSISADGAVPLSYRVESGNTSDDTTHVATWDQLRELVGRDDFLYIADGKLASEKALRHIDANHGRFVTVLANNRKEVTWFKKWTEDHAPSWSEARRRPARRDGDHDEVWRTFESPLPSNAGYRVIWVHSNSKQTRDAATRAARIAAGLAALEALSVKLCAPRCRLKSVVAVESAVERALEDTRAARFFTTRVEEVPEESFRQATRGRPGPASHYVKRVTSRFTLSFNVRSDVVSADAKSDGTFPLLTNDSVMTPAEVLNAYKYQPNLERRHAQLKGHQLVAPVFLKDPVRIEGLLCCHFFALVIQALIEREIRGAMKTAHQTSIALYPELRECAAPSAHRVLEIFAHVARHVLRDADGTIVKIYEPTLTPLQFQVLELLGIPASVYAVTKSASS